jgi:hypothetical protein
MTKYHHIQEVVFKDNKMSLKVDGTEYIFQIEKISKKLAKASKSELERFEISPSGYGIHWPLLDEDLSVDGLLGIEHRPLKKKKMVLT